MGLGAPGKVPLPAFQGYMPVLHLSAGTALGLVPKITQMHQYLEENIEQQLLSFTIVMLWTFKMKNTQVQEVSGGRKLSLDFIPISLPPPIQTYPSHDHTSFTFTSWTHWSGGNFGTVRTNTLPWCLVSKGFKSLAKLKRNRKTCTVTAGPHSQIKINITYDKRPQNCLRHTTNRSSFEENLECIIFRRKQIKKKSW